MVKSEICNMPKKKDATHRRKTKWSSKTLGEWTKKKCDTHGALQVGYKEHVEQPLSEMSYTHWDSFGFVPLPSFGRTKPPPTRSATTKLLWKLYTIPSQ
jgi:hypothetical protein